MKIENLKKIPLRIVNELQYIKELEEKNKKHLMIYRETEAEIKEQYKYLERLVNVHEKS